MVISFVNCHLGVFDVSSKVCYINEWCTYSLYSVPDTKKFYRIMAYLSPQTKSFKIHPHLSNEFQKKSYYIMRTYRIKTYLPMTTSIITVEI